MTGSISFLPPFTRGEIKHLNVPGIKSGLSEHYKPMVYLIAPWPLGPLMISFATCNWTLPSSIRLKSSWSSKNKDVVDRKWKLKKIKKTEETFRVIFSSAARFELVWTSWKVKVCKWQKVTKSKFGALTFYPTALLLDATLIITIFHSVNKFISWKTN